MMTAGERHRRVRWVVGLGVYVIASACAHLPPSAPNAFEPTDGADVHRHLSMHAALPFSREPDGSLAHCADDRWSPQWSVEQMRASKMHLIVTALWPRPSADELREVRHQVEALRRFVDANPQLALVTSAHEARRVISQGRTAVVMALEGAGAISRVADVDALYALGIRVVGLVHFFDNAVADAEDNQFGALGILTNGSQGGLTDLGRQVVRRMVERGVLIDVEHSSTQTLRDVLALTEPAHVPIIDSHVGATFLKPYSLDDDLARRIAANHGLVGIGVYRDDLLMPVPQADRFAGFVERTCDEVIARWLHYTKLLGEHAVILGSDFGSPILRPLPGGSCAEGLRHAGDVAPLYEALVQHGLRKEALNGAAARILDVLERVEHTAVKLTPQDECGSWPCLPRSRP